MTWERQGRSGDAYDAAYDVRAAGGQDVHGEATFVQRFTPHSVLDAGCGTGRVARELARRGIEVVGVDRDAEMLATARRKAPQLDWRLDDIAVVEIGRTFDAVLLAGNVMIFVHPGTEGVVLGNMARHLQPRGHVIAGFELTAGLTIETYDALAAAAGLTLVERWSTWNCDAWNPGGAYAVSVHQMQG